MSMQVLGAKRKHLSGYSAATQGLHEGFIFGSEIIQVSHPCTNSCPSWHGSQKLQMRRKAALYFTCDCSGYCVLPLQGTPPGLRKKASRLVGGKCTLLARIDAYGQDPTGSSGADMKVQ